MPYLNEAGLSRYDPQLKEWISAQPVKTLPSSLYPWTLSEKAGAVGVWPVGGTEMKPTVDFLFTETPPASGDKGPENPSTITGVSQIFLRRTSDNFITVPYKWFADYQTTSYTDHDVTYTLNSDYSITINGTASGNSYFALLGEDLQNVWFPAGTYKLKATGNSNIALVFNYVSSSVFATTGDYVKSFSSGFYGRVYYRIYSGSAVNNVTVYPQVFFNSEGSNVFSVVPGFSTTIPLGDTYYGGSVDLSTGVMTVTWIGKILDRSSLVAANAGFTWEGADKLSKRLFFKLNGEATGFPAIKDVAHITCSHFRKLLDNSVQSDLIFGTFYVNTASARWTMFYDNDMTIVDDSKTVYENRELFIDWFEAKKQAGDPVYLVYELKEPQTVQLSPVQIFALAQANKYTPILNTIYTDASAVQVGYVKSPIREEFELTQAIAAQGGNI